MMARLATKLLALTLTATLAVAVGCGDETSGEDNRENTGQQPPEESELLFASDQCQGEEPRCAIPLTIGQSVDLEVQLVEDGEPVEDVLVDFDLVPQDGAQDTTLDSGSTFTDSDGVADVEFRAQDEENLAGMIGHADVYVSVPQDENIEELTFAMSISSKDAASYIIEFVNEGASTPDHVEPLLYDPDEHTCEGLRESFFDTHTWPTAELAMPNATVNADGSINTVDVANIDNNDSYVVVGVAQQEIGDEDVDVGYGCKEGPEILDGQHVQFEVPLNDHIPHLDERYDMTSQFNIAGALPGPVETIVDLLDTLANNPEEFIISGNSDTTGLIDDILLDFLPDFIADEVEAILDSSLAVGAIQEFIGNYIDDWMPDSLATLQDAIGDLTAALQEFTVSGQLNFDEQPTPALDDDGLAVGEISADHTSHIWDTLTFQWSYGCDDDAPAECSEVPITTSDLGAGQDDIIEGEFDATVIGTSYIDIETHPLTLHYGALLVGVVEQMVLPRVFGEDEDGNPIDSLDALFDDLIGCDTLASYVGDEDGGLYDAAYNMCTDLRNEASDALYSYITDNLQAGGDGFVIGTPEDGPCEIQQPPNYDSGTWPGEPLPYINTFGLQDDGMGCDWIAEITFTGDDPNAELEGDFEAERAD